MTPNELYIKDIAISYADKDITTIPVNQKSPIINEWNNLKPLTDEYGIHDRLEEMWASKFKEATGLGVVLGQDNPRLSCVDIDSYDNEIVDRLLIALNAQYIKRGKKGCSFFFYREFDTEKSMEIFKIPGGGQVEVFYRNKQIVIPPSLHSWSDNGEGCYYSWDREDCALLNIDMISDLPSLSQEEIDNIPLLLGSPSIHSANKNLPVSIQYNERGEADGRFNAVKSFIGTLVAASGRVITMSEIVFQVLKFDAENFSKNSFFEWEFNKRRKEIKKGNAKELNAIRFCTEIVASLDMDNKITMTESMNVPIDVDNPSFRTFVPIKIENKGSAPAIFTDDMIPLVWKDLIIDAEECLGMPKHVLFFSMLTTLGACLQTKITIQPYENDTWFVMPNMTIMILAPSGSKKSDVIKLATYQAKIIQSELESSNSREILDEEKLINNKIEALHRNAKKANDAGDEEAAKNLLKEMYREQDKLEELKNRITQTEWMDELGTIQKMILDASRNEKNGMFLVLDEFNQIRATKKKKGNEDAHNFFMRLIDGDKSFKTKTILRGTDRIEHCIGSILTACQPDVFDTIIADLHNPRTDSNDGFMQRFPPISFGEFKNIRTKPLDFNKHKKAYEIFSHAFKMHPKTVHVTKSARDKYEDFKFEVRERAKRPSSSVLGSYLFKHEGMIARFGYLAEFLRHRGKELGISEDGLEMAWKWLQFMHDDLLNTFKISDELNDVKEQLKIIEMIKCKMLSDGQTMSQWYQSAKGSFRFVDVFIKHLYVLQDHGYITLIDVNSKTKIIKVNPLLWIL